MQSPRIDLYVTAWRKSSYSNPDGGDCVEVAEWRKSSHSNPDGGNCVEVAEWRKSSHSNSDGGDCLQVADHIPTAVPVRDSKDPDGPALVFATPAWTAFVRALKRTAP
ncbi:DUF397 domain-containing protein [Streptomyces sp. NPDC053048]|uniref:DUF397 domain-containing protein n=1 Tax=Streptomyces sp. NPDC053048 TaxID=3365694 RepID=UPI0037D01FAF